MKAVDVKQLKARLSEYLRLVRTGETVLITDRDEVVAELRPARRQSAGGLSTRWTQLGDDLIAIGDQHRLARPDQPKVLRKARLELLDVNRLHAIEGSPRWSRDQAHSMTSLGANTG